MNHVRLSRMSQAQLAGLLAHSGRGSDQWQQLRNECERRARRWEQVADCALIGLLVCFALITSAVIAG